MAQYYTVTSQFFLQHHNLLFSLLLGLVPERSSKMATKPAAAAESGPRNRTRLQTPVWVGRIPAAVLWSFPARFLVGGCAAHTHHPRRTEHTDIHKSAVVVNKRRLRPLQHSRTTKLFLYSISNHGENVLVFLHGNFHRWLKQFKLGDCIVDCKKNTFRCIPIRCISN